MTKVIEIIVTMDGKTTMQTKGFMGDSCRDASRFLEEALGKCSTEQLTAEFHQTDTVQQTQAQRS